MRLSKFVLGRARAAQNGLRTYAHLLAGDYAALTQSRVSEDLAAEIRWRLLKDVKRHTSAMAAANLLNAGILVASLWSTPLRDFSLVWAAVVASFALLLMVGRAKRRPRAESQRASADTMARAIRNSALLGAIWGAMPVLFFANAPPEGRIVIACLCAGMMGGGAFALATLPAAAVSMITPIVLGSVLSLARDGGHAAAPIMWLLSIYFAMLVAAMFDHALEAVNRAVSRLEIQRLSRRDGLTDLGNHAALLDALQLAGLRLAGGGEAHTLLCLDIVGMREVNQRLGYTAGDELLRQAAERLRASVRKLDFAARVSGDQFAVLVNGLGGEATARAYANSVLAAFAKPFRLSSGEATINAVVGVAIALADDAGSTDLLRNANLALSSAKRAGRGGAHFYTPDQDAGRQKRDALEIDLRRALDQGGLRLHFQPFLNVETREIAGFEALLRWPHPIHGLIPPEEIVLIAEERGLVDAVGFWILREACAVARAWPGDMRVAVNISSRQLRSSALPLHVAAALAEARLPAARLEIEVTESSLIDDHDMARYVLSTLRDAGVKLALDDFGVGYSALNYLRRLPFDRIKIDRSFMLAALTEANSSAIVRAILTLAGDLGMATTAEGVETIEQLEYLRGIGCHEAQGYYIARPMPDADIAMFLEDWTARGSRRAAALT